MKSDERRFRVQPDVDIDSLMGELVKKVNNKCQPMDVVRLADHSEPF